MAHPKQVREGWGGLGALLLPMGWGALLWRAGNLARAGRLFQQAADAGLALTMTKVRSCGSGREVKVRVCPAPS